jgi:hypothetical protein
MLRGWRSELSLGRTYTFAFATFYHALHASSETLTFCEKGKKEKAEISAGKNGIPQFSN